MTGRAHRRRTTIALLVALAGLVYGLTKAIPATAGLDLSGIPSVVWGFVAGLLIAARLTFRAGRYMQAWDHSRRGVLRGHLRLIRGH